MPAARSSRLHLRVVHKLFLMLALAIALALGTQGGITMMNLRSGFVAYVNALDLASLSGLVQQLDQRPDAAQGFAGLRDRAQWDALLHRWLEPGPPPDNALASPRPPPPPLGPAAPGGHPPPPSAMPLPPRISLLDARHRLIAGSPPPADALLRPLRQNGVPVGWLALRPLTHPVQSRDADFLSAQVRAMSWLAAVLLLLAVAVAWFFARHLLAPLREVEHAARQLAEGHYRLHLATTRRDELGDLVRHVNRLGAALHAHETARRQWIADISHELRTPLAIVRGELEAMQDGLRRPDADGLQSLHGEVLRLDRLVGDLHQLSMADLGSLSHRPQLLDLAALLREACARFERAAGEAGLALVLDVSAATVRADADRLRQLIDNVLGNSLRYSDRGGSVRIALVAADGLARVTFDDTPPGVDAEALARLFEPLYRAEASRNRVRGGSGLGLAIAQRIARAHAGKLQALPSPLGGLRIALTLPLAVS